MGLYYINLTLLALCCAAEYATTVNEAAEHDILGEKRTPKLLFKPFNPIVDLDSFEPWDASYNKRNIIEMGNHNNQRDTRAPLGTMRFGKRNPLGTMRFGKRSSQSSL